MMVLAKGFNLLFLGIGLEGKQPAVWEKYGENKLEKGTPRKH